MSLYVVFLRQFTAPRFSFYHIPFSSSISSVIDVIETSVRIVSGDLASHQHNKNCVIVNKNFMDAIAVCNSI